MRRSGIARREGMAFDHLNIAGRAFKSDPYPWFARMRSEAPVCRVSTPDRQPTWLVTRYDDVVGLLRDERFIKDRHVAWTCPASPTATSPSGWACTSASEHPSLARRVRSRSGPSFRCSNCTSRYHRAGFDDDPACSSIVSSRCPSDSPRRARHPAGRGS
jgi:hypothetical protein